MRERFAGDLALAGRAYQDLFSGEDTREAEAAAQHLANVLCMIQGALTPKS